MRVPGGCSADPSVRQRVPRPPLRPASGSAQPRAPEVRPGWSAQPWPTRLHRCAVPLGVGRGGAAAYLPALLLRDMEAVSLPSVSQRSCCRCSSMCVLVHVGKIFLLGIDAKWSGLLWASHECVFIFIDHTTIKPSLCQTRFNSDW